MREEAACPRPRPGAARHWARGRWAATAALAVSVLAWAAFEPGPVTAVSPRDCRPAFRCAGAPLAGLLVLGAAVPAPALEPAKAISQYSHAVWQERNGLPGDMVSAILQTRDGYLWFGTLNGLARFDGLRFTTFDPQGTPAPLLHRIRSLYE